MNKQSFFRIGFFAAFLVVFTAFKPVAAQGVKITKVDEPLSVIEDTTVLKSVYEIEVLPKFPGGQEALNQFLIKNLEYPKGARGVYKKGKTIEEGVQGRVVIGFIVEQNGKVSNIEVKKSVHPLLDAEALRVVKLMPDWEPGKQNGKPVRVYFQLPIEFQLD
jgi:protein TonB